MREIPPARVVRGGARERDGERDGEREARPGADTAPKGRVLRLAPRALPWALVVRLLFGGPFASFGWLFAAAGMWIIAAKLPMGELRGGGYDRQTIATTTAIEDAGASTGSTASGTPRR